MRARFLLAWTWTIVLAAVAYAAGPAEFVIHVSVDGLGSVYLQDLLERHQVPTFARFQSEGAWTHNARTDFDYTITLPNHTSMVTSRPVKDRAGVPSAVAGHGWTINTDPGQKTLHSNRHDYVSSAFDVAHDNGLRTCMLASKSKFSLYDQSYDARNGAPDTIGPDNGRDKMDLYVKANSDELTDRFLAETKAHPFNYSFLHFHDTDTAGHTKGWGTPEYQAAVIKVDGLLGRVVEFVSTDERFKNKTAIIVSADHGGVDLNHGVNSNPLNYTIPFYVWGAGVAHTDDLYALNSASRANPGTARPDYSDPLHQPIRNGDGGNLALMLLGLGPIPDSSINAKQDLHVH